MDGAPILGAPVIINNGRDFSQTCSVNYRRTVGEFKLEWFFDGVLYKTVILTNGTRADSLYANDWSGHLGHNLNCQVTPLSSETSKNITDQSVSSQTYFGGIKIFPDALRLIEYKSQTITVTSTLPVMCSNSSADDCKLELTVSIVGPDLHRILVMDGCSLQLRRREWDPTSNTIATSFILATAVDRLVKYQAEYLVGVRVLPSNNDHNMWKAYTPSDIKVFTNDVVSRECLVFGQSHVITTHQGRTNINHPGDFMLFNGTTKDENHLQVQARLWTPDDMMATVCAVAVQYNEALVIVDMCTNNINRPAPVITQGESNPDDVRVYLCGSSYRIVNGDGSGVTVSMQERHLDVKVDIPGSHIFYDRGDTACLVHGAHEDLPLDKIMSWWLDSKQSLFLEAGQKFFEVKSQVPAPAPNYCTCGGGVSECDPFLRVHDPVCVFLQNKQMRCETDCVLIVPRSVNPASGTFQVMNPLNYSQPQILFPNMLDEATVKQQCLETITNYSSHYCQHRYNGDRSLALDACIHDYKYSGGYDYMSSIVQGFEWMCENRLFETPINYFSHPDGGFSLTDPVLHQLCPDLCNEKGFCLNGSCVCDKGFKGTDCSIEENVPPRILGIKGGSSCEFSSNHCFWPILVTRNVERNHNLIVKVHETHPNTSDYFLEPVYENKFSVSLPLTHLANNFHDQRVVTLSVSNDGVVFSNTVTYTVYDNECRYCLQTGCTQKESTCHIDGKCYDHGAVNPNNSNQVCDPDRALIRWSDGPVSIKPPATLPAPVVG